MLSQKAQRELALLGRLDGMKKIYKYPKKRLAFCFQIGVV